MCRAGFDRLQSLALQAGLGEQAPQPQQGMFAGGSAFQRVVGDEQPDAAIRRQAGGGHVLCPDALADDGLLDISILPAPQEVVGTLRNLMTDGWGLDNIFVRARLPWVEIKVADGLYINLDGEPLKGDDLRFSALPKALRVHLPVGSPLVVEADDLLAHRE